MKQLSQNLKTGEMTLFEGPFPALGHGQIRVRNHYSVISAGTESRTVKDARAGYLGKAKSRPGELKKVVEAIIEQWRGANLLRGDEPSGHAVAARLQLRR